MMTSKAEAEKMCPILSFFEYAHLSLHLQEVSKPMHDLAWDMVMILDQSEEVYTGLRKLLEAKDCLVRARL